MANNNMAQRREIPQVSLPIAPARPSGLPLPVSNFPVSRPTTRSIIGGGRRESGGASREWRESSVMKRDERERERERERQVALATFLHRVTDYTTDTRVKAR